MARGFHVRLSIHDPEWLTPGHVADAAREQGQWLSEREVLEFIPGAVEAAKALIGAVKYGPYFVYLDGIDNYGVHGEATQIVVSVDSGATEVPGQTPISEVTSSSTEVEPDEGPEPDSSGAPASVDSAAPSDETPGGE